MKSLCLVALGCALCLYVSAQEAKSPYVIGVTLWASDHPQLSCPIFVGGVGRNSPAAQAGIQPGDRLLTIDGIAVTGLEDASKRLPSPNPGPVVVGLGRGEVHYTATIQREDYTTLLHNNGMKQLDRLEVDMDTTEAEVRDLLAEQQAVEGAFRAGDVTVAFPDHHYPANKQLYYPGFEVFVWDKGQQITVGGIENGPAYRSGIRWGDRILTVNGVDPHGKSIAAMEALLSSPQPAPMVLTISRAGTQKTFSFTLEQASDVLRENRWKVVHGQIVPLWIPDKYLPCFEK